MLKVLRVLIEITVALTAVNIFGQIAQICDAAYRQTGAACGGNQLFHLFLRGYMFNVEFIN